MKCEFDDNEARFHVHTLEAMPRGKRQSWYMCEERLVEHLKEEA